MTINEKCKGCNNLESCLLIYYLSPISKCPCSTCLVKMICTTRCSERISLFQNIAHSIVSTDKKNRSKGNTYGKYK